jgi:putative hydrolase of the HAD superfamily
MNVVFDFGAVLFTWRPVDLVAQHFPRQAGTPALASALARSIFYHPDWHDFDCGRVSLDDVVSRTAKRLELPAAEVMALVGPIGEQLAPIACNVALLDQLRVLRDLRGARNHVDPEGQGGLRLYFLSNMPAPYARALEQRHAFLRWFDGGIFSGDVQLGKPDPAIFTLLARRYGLTPSNTLFIDDARVNVQAAQGLGWHAIECAKPEALPEQMATYLAKFVSH